MDRSLVGMPSEVLALITPYLELGVLLYRLRATGNVLLWNKITKQRGCLSIDCSGAIWNHDSFATVDFRTFAYLQRLTIKLGAVSLVDDPDTFVRSLPKGLTEIDFEFREASTCWLQRAGPELSQKECRLFSRDGYVPVKMMRLLPRLSILHLRTSHSTPLLLRPNTPVAGPFSVEANNGTPRAIEWTSQMIWYFFSHLPSGLISLTPTSQISNPPCLPDSLLHIIHSESKTNPFWRWESISNCSFMNLLTLHLETNNGSNLASLLNGVPSLSTLRLLHESTSELPLSMLLSVPRQVTRLEIILRSKSELNFFHDYDNEQSARGAISTAFPPSLTHLVLQPPTVSMFTDSSGNLSPVNFSGSSETFFSWASFLDLIPATVTNLEIILGTFVDLKLLPRGLRHLNLRSAASSFSMDDLQYLPPLYELILDHCDQPMTDEDVAQLPRTIRVLNLETAKLITSDCFPMLPPNLTSLLTGSSRCLDTSMAQLPRNLTYYKPRFIGISGKTLEKTVAHLDASTIIKSLPISSQSVRNGLLTVVDQMKNADRFILSILSPSKLEVPPSLTSLDLRPLWTDYCSLMPGLMKYSPSLTSIIINDPEGSELDMSACEFPPKLTRLSILGSSGKHSSPGISKLPELIELDFPSLNWKAKHPLPPKLTSLDVGSLLWGDFALPSALRSLKVRRRFVTTPNGLFAILPRSLTYVGLNLPLRPGASQQKDTRKGTWQRGIRIEISGGVEYREIVSAGLHESIGHISASLILLRPEDLTGSPTLPESVLEFKSSKIPSLLSSKLFPLATIGKKTSWDIDWTSASDLTLLPRSLKTLEMRSSIPTASLLTQLPSSLTRADFGEDATPFPSGSVRILPRSVTDLCLNAEALGVQDFQNLPPNLAILNLGAVRSAPAVHLKQLPSSLESLKLLCHEVSDDFPGSLPRGLKTLCAPNLQTLGGKDVSQLPPGLQTLLIPTYLASSTQFASFLVEGRLPFCLRNFPIPFVMDAISRPLIAPRTMAPVTNTTSSVPNYLVMTNAPAQILNRAPGQF